MENQNKNVDVAKLLEILVKLYLINTKQFLNTEETAFYLGFKPRTVRKLNEDGKLMGRKYKKSGYLFFDKEEVLKYQQNNLRVAASFD